MLTSSTNSKSIESGQVMVEILVALAAAAVALLALAAVITNSLRNIRYSKDAGRANQYAQQSLENVRAYRDRQGFTNLSAGCYSQITASSATPLASCGSGVWGTISGTSYRRKIEVVDELETKKEVTVIIAWSDSACDSGEFCHQVEVETFLTKWH